MTTSFKELRIDEFADLLLKPDGPLKDPYQQSAIETFTNIVAQDDFFVKRLVNGRFNELAVIPFYQIA